MTKIAIFLLLAACAGQQAKEPVIDDEEVDQKPVTWQPAPPPRDDVIYFILVDRFANGNVTNDGEVHPADPQAFHGGDIAGVIEHLDELRDLGVRTIWLSPVFKSRTDKFFEWGAYHGYWVEDYGQIEPRFGTVEELRRLSDELLKRDMRLVLDVVLNHVAMDARLEKEKPDWFHPTCDIGDWNDARQLTDCRVHGLPDLNQENDEVYRYLVQQSLSWVKEVQPHGFRVDAVRHMRNSFLGRLSADIQAQAGPGFLMLGEDFEGDALKLSQTFAEGGFGAMFDFPLHYAMLDTFCHDRPPGRIAATLSTDDEYENPNRLVPFLDNHDRPRLQSICQGDEQRVTNALTFLFTTRGIPSLTYGTEVGLDGAEEPHNRKDMLFGVESQRRTVIKKLIAQRRAHRSLQVGATQILALEGSFFAYARIVPSEAAIIAVNSGVDAVEWTIPQTISQDSQLTALDGASLEGTTLKVAPSSVVTLIATRNEPFIAPVSDVERLVQLTVHGAPATGQIYLVGNGPQLGNWDPQKGLGPLKAAKDGTYGLEFQYRVGRVMEFKVIEKAKAQVTWQDGENQYLLVGAGEGPLSAKVTR